MGNTVGLVPTNGWINGLLSCFNWNIIGKGKAPQIEQSEPFQNSNVVLMVKTCGWNPG